MDLNKDSLYLDMLQDILDKKSDVLDELLILTSKQELLLRAQEFDNATFILLLDSKEAELKKIEEFDKGFEIVYEKIKIELVSQKMLYQDKIIELQNKIKTIIEKSIELKSLEKQNQNLLTVCLSSARKKIKDFKMNKQVASNYYKNMAKLQSTESYFLDSKR